MQVTPESCSSSLIVGAAAALAGISVLTLIPVQIPGEGWHSITNLQSPAFFPILNAIFLTVCGISLMTTAWRLPADTADDAVPASHPVTFVAVAVLLAVYLVMIKFVGMVVSSGVVIAAMAVLLGYRNKAVIAACALIFPLVIYLLFEKVLKILLPHGAVF